MHDKQPIKILIVEDNSSVSKLLCAYLGNKGHNICAVATNTSTALTQVATEIPDVAIVDIHLEGEDSGIDFVKQVQREVQLPIIYLTGCIDEELIEQAKDTKPLGFLTKPVKNFASLDIALKAATPDAHQKNLETIENQQNSILDVLNRMMTIGERVATVEITLAEVNKALVKNSETTSENKAVVTRLETIRKIVFGIVGSFATFVMALAVAWVSGQYDPFASLDRDNQASIKEVKATLNNIEATDSNLSERINILNERLDAINSRLNHLKPSENGVIYPDQE